MSCDAKSKTVFIARVVARAFHGEPPTPEHEVNHKNGVKTDNRASNLEWVTKSENQRHAYRTGLKKPMRGQQHGRAKLSNSSVRKIRLAKGTCAAIGAQFGVDPTTISRIRRRVRWSHVQ